MAYKNYRRRRTYKKKYTKKQGGWSNVANKALKVARYVAKQINAETKDIETSVVGFNPTYSGSVTTLNSIAQGVAANQREGDSIKMKTLTLRGLIDGNGANSDQIRIIVLIDKQNNITTGSQLLQYTGTSNCTLSDKLDENRYDTKIILDRTFQITNTVTMRKLDVVLRIPYHVNFVPGSSTIANNALKIWAFSNTVAGAGITFQYIARVSYLDN